MDSSSGYSRWSGRVMVGGLLLVPLLAVAIIFVIYFAKMGPSDKSYVETMVTAKKQAADVVQRVNLASVYRALKQYAAVNEGKFPASADELTREAGLPQNYLDSYIYIAGQDETMPGSNVLIYEQKLRPSGKCEVLRLNGQIEMLSLEDVRQAVDRASR